MGRTSWPASSGASPKKGVGVGRGEGRGVPNSGINSPWHGILLSLGEQIYVRGGEVEGAGRWGGEGWTKLVPGRNDEAGKDEERKGLIRDLPACYFGGTPLSTVLTEALTSDRDKGSDRDPKDRNELARGGEISMRPSLDHRVRKFLIPTASCDTRCGLAFYLRDND
ncbi:hypothetical protein KM043_014299 [Ampulex compressa]|nr:hypothetical protein KM043_014299 [Ampulex compressa]